MAKLGHHGQNPTLKLKLHPGQMVNKAQVDFTYGPLQEVVYYLVRLTRMLSNK